MFEIIIGSLRIKGEYILLIVVFWVLFGHLICGCSRVGMYEGFGLLADNLGASAPYKLGDYSKTDTSKWGQPDLTTQNGQQSIMNRQKQRLPLPEGELLLLNKTSFKPECCPNTYSNASGCACMDTSTLDYLRTRGGNNVPYSEY